MDGDIGSMLESVLSNPEQLEKIAQMAKGFMGQAPAVPGEPTAASTPTAVSGGLSAGNAGGLPLGGIDERLLSTLGKVFAGNGGDRKRSTALLVAMRPYMREEKQEKLDRAMRLAKLVSIAGVVMKEYGGDFGGL